jgi:4-hydroxy-2-oxoheptanedioate aldolase
MLSRTDSLKTRLRKAEVVSGTALVSGSPEAVDVSGAAGLDFLRIDLSHSLRRDGRLEELLRAAHAAGVATIVRLDRHETGAAGAILDAGATGILIAGVRGSSDAADAVAACRFPPVGERGFSPSCFSAGWGARDAGEWIAGSNRDVLVGVTVENRQALEDIDAIASVPGLDLVQFGWSDFSLSLGLPAPSAGHPEVEAARKRVFAAARAAGVFVMMGIGSGREDVKRALDLDVQLLEFGRDLTVLADAWRSAKKLTGECVKERNA